MPTRTAVVSMVFALSTAGIAIDAQAQGIDIEKAYKQGACSNDLKKFCARVKPGEGRIAACMADKFRQLEPGCRATVQAAIDKRGSMAKACKADAEKFCKGIRPGEGGILSCLKGRESALSPACGAEFKRVGSDPTAAQ